MRPVLITGGAPRVAIDAVRHLTVAASGSTALQLRSGLRAYGVEATCLLSVDAAADDEALRYREREDLEAGMRDWIETYPSGVVVMTAAINDYQLHAVDTTKGDHTSTWQPGQKIPSRADEVCIRLRPASKIIDQLVDWGHAGPLVACKYQAAETVIEAAQHLQQRVKAALVLANSLDGSVQALIDSEGIHPAPDRSTVVARLTQRIAELATAPS